MSAQARRLETPETRTAGQCRADEAAWGPAQASQPRVVRVPQRPPPPPRWLIAVWCAAWIVCLGVAAAAAWDTVGGLAGSLLDLITVRS